MEQSQITSYTIGDFLEWQASKQLVITPKFQRRDVWALNAKSYLIDTILRGMPIPPLFIRLRIDPAARRAQRDVVDGQQRLRAVLGFIQGEFAVQKVHNKEYGGSYYSDLPEDVQKRFLGYRFAVNVLDDVSDADVLSIFARINTYTVTLNAQELRNATYFGAFKQLVYALAHQHYAFWRNFGILSDKQLTRMMDAELVSELVVTMLDGIRSTKKADLKVFYDKYEHEFTRSRQVEQQFNITLDTIGNILGNRLRETQFHRVPMFYSLFTLIFDAAFGLPNSEHSRVQLDHTKTQEIMDRLLAFDAICSEVPINVDFVRFVDASRLSTADPGKRRLRHDFMWTYVFQDIASN